MVSSPDAEGRGPHSSRFYLSYLYCKATRGSLEDIYRISHRAECGNPRQLESTHCNWSKAEYRGHLAPRYAHTASCTHSQPHPRMHTPGTQACAWDTFPLYHMDKGDSTLLVSTAALQGRTEITPRGTGRLLAFKDTVTRRNPSWKKK